MARLMSVAMTTTAVIERRKTVTRRKGWTFLKPGDRLALCQKVRGRKPGEPLVRLAEVEVVGVRREPLSWLRSPGAALWWAETEIAAEGFPGMDPRDFVQRFFIDAQGMSPDDEVTRIEWRYLPDTVPTPGRTWTDPMKVDGGKQLKRPAVDLPRVKGSGFNARGNQEFAGQQFLHDSRIPLRNADLRAAWERAVDDGQGDLFDGAALGLDCSAGVCFT